jgi:hypothetical protein
MPILTPLQALRIGFVIAPLLFLASAYFTRANGRRILSALAGAVAYGVLTYSWDRAAGSLGWWHYPYAPAIARTMLALYVPAGLVAGGAFGLVGWRLIRRFGWRGLAGFLLAWGTWGVIHDVGGSAVFADSNLMVFESGAAPVVADFLNYATCGAFAQLAIRLLAGPADADPLRRTKPAPGGQKTWRATL